MNESFVFYIVCRRKFTIISVKAWPLLKLLQMMLLARYFEKSILVVFEQWAQKWFLQLLLSIPQQSGMEFGSKSGSSSLLEQNVVKAQRTHSLPIIHNRYSNLLKLFLSLEIQTLQLYQSWTFHALLKISWWNKL
jgi:hypothetical protein